MTTPKNRFHVLLIGIDCYLPSQSDCPSYRSLQGCVSDINRVANFLKVRLGVTDEQMIRLTSSNGGDPEPPEPAAERPTYEIIVAAFNRIYEQTAPGDQVYIHFSGHGGRTPTAFGELKGPEALDESLAPYDIGKPTARYLRDVELGCFLRRLEARGVMVTVVLDCCHSGGATRGGGARVRGGGFIDRTNRPTESLVASRQDLLASWQAASMVMRGLTSAIASVGGGHVLLAACRPAELAHEYELPSGKSTGALTNFLLEELDRLGAGQTWKDLYGRVQPRVHGLFPGQTPLLQGDVGRVVLGTEQGLVQFETLVTKVDAPGSRVQLQAGQATGVTEGAHFAIYPQGEIDLQEKQQRTALVRVTNSRATESWAEVIERYSAHPIQNNDSAVLLGAGNLNLVRRVRLMRADGSPVTESDTALKAVERELSGNGWLNLAGEGQTDYLLTLSADASTYEICDPSGNSLPNLRPALGVSDPQAARNVVRRLVHLARFRAVSELANNDWPSQVFKKVTFELVGWQNDFKPSNKPNPQPFATDSPMPTLRVGQWAFLRIKNVSARELNIAILNLEPTWRIAQVFPFASSNLYYEPLDRGQEFFPWLSLQASLPPGYDEAIDTLKVFATQGPTNFRVLELPPLDNPVIITRQATRGPVSALDRLLAAVTADQPRTRSLAPPGVSPGEEWESESVRVQIVR